MSDIIPETLNTLRVTAGENSGQNNLIPIRDHILGINNALTGSVLKFNLDMGGFEDNNEIVTLTVLDTENAYLREETITPIFANQPNYIGTRLDQVIWTGRIVKSNSPAPGTPPHRKNSETGSEDESDKEESTATTSSDQNRKGSRHQKQIKDAEKSVTCDKCTNLAFGTKRQCGGHAKSHHTGSEASAMDNSDILETPGPSAAKLAKVDRESSPPMTPMSMGMDHQKPIGQGMSVGADIKAQGCLPGPMTSGQTSQTAPPGTHQLEPIQLAKRPPVEETASFLQSLLASNGPNYLENLFGSKARDALEHLGGVEKVAIALSESQTIEDFGAALHLMRSDLEHLRSIFMAVENGDMGMLKSLGIKDSELGNVKFFLEKLVNTGFLD